MSADTNPWWHRFFDGDNRLRWPELEKRETPWSDQVLPWIELVRDADVDLPIVLPRLDANGQPSWYCAGRSTRGTLRLREALQAFIGPSYSDFDGKACVLRAEDPVETAFAEGTVAPAYRIRASNTSDVGKIQRMLQLYRGLLGRMPNEVEHARRPLGVLRAELDRAVAASDENEACGLLEHIRRVGRLDAENLLYLQIGVRAGLGQWREIAEDTELLNQLSGLRLPPKVLVDVHEALYRKHIEPSEDVAEPSRALETFRAAGLTRRSALYGTRRGLRSARVLKAFFLYELTREDLDQTLLTNLAHELEQTNDAFAHALARLLPETELQAIQDPIRAADAAFDDLEVDRALELYLLLPPSKKRTSRLIRCAEDVGSKEAAKRVLDAVNNDQHTKSLPEFWTDKLRSLEQLCRGDSSDQSPQGWLDWARRVGVGLGIDQAMSTLREHGNDWDSVELMQQADQLAEIIDGATEHAESVFREAAPLLYEAIVPNSGAPPRQAKPLLQILVTRVAFSGDPSQNELKLARDLAAALLVMGLDEKDYAGLISDLGDLLGTQMSVFTLSWALDLMELLAVHACPDSEKRLRLVLSVVEKVRRCAHRLSHSDALVVEHLCDDYGISCPTEFTSTDDSDDVETGKALSGKKVGIYTLTDAAGQRAANLLQRLYPEVRVEVNGDHDCTKRLVNLARTADIFVFAWKSSKHQAFYCVKDHRDGANPLIQAEGKGTSSILRAVLENV